MKLTRKNFLPILIALLFVTIFATLLEASDSSTVALSASADITAHTVCRKVTNNSVTGLSVYVPTVTSAEWTSFQTSPPTGVAVATCTQSCTLPWGGTIAHGQSVTAYATSNVGCGSSCSSQTRTCNNGVLSGSYTNQSCSVAACPSYTWHDAGYGVCSPGVPYCGSASIGASCSSPGLVCDNDPFNSAAWCSPRYACY